MFLVLFPIYLSFVNVGIEKNELDIALQILHSKIGF